MTFGVTLFIKRKKNETKQILTFFSLTSAFFFFLHNSTKGLQLRLATTCTGVCFLKKTLFF